MSLGLTTAGESHGPALVAILTGLPAGLVLDRAAIDADLRRRQQGYGRSPRQQLEQDEVEVLAGLRHGRTLGTPLALVVRNRDHKNWEWGMNPWPPEGEPSGKGTKPVTLPRPGHADLAGVLKYGHEDVRDALERASARHTAVYVAAGAVAKALLRELGIEVAGSVLEIGGERESWEAAIDAARVDRDTLGGIVEVRATGVFPGLGSYATREERLDARLAARADGDPGGEGRRDRRRVRARPASVVRRLTTRSTPACARRSNRAGGIEAGVSNGEEIVVRAAMKPLPTLMKPLDSVDLATGEPAQALVERSDVAAVEALAVVAEAVVAWELARAAREKLGGDALADMKAAHAVLPGAHTHALGRHVALIGFMGAGKSTLGAALAERLGRPFVDVDRELEREEPIARIFETGGEAAFRLRESKHARDALASETPAVVALGGGAVGTDQIQKALRDRALTILVEIDPEEAWRRVEGGDRPLAQDEAAFRTLYEQRRPLYDAAADARTADLEGAVLAAGGVHVETGALERLGELVPGDGQVEIVSDARVAGIYGMDVQLALGARARAIHELAPGEQAKTVESVEALWHSLRLERSGHARRARRRLHHGRRRTSRPRATSAGSTGSPSRRRSSARSTRRSAARPRSTFRARRTSSAPSTGPSGR